MQHFVMKSIYFFVLLYGLTTALLVLFLYAYNHDQLVLAQFSWYTMIFGISFASTMGVIRSAVNKQKIGQVRSEYEKTEIPKFRVLLFIPIAYSVSVLLSVFIYSRIVSPPYSNIVTFGSLIMIYIILGPSIPRYFINRYLFPRQTTHKGIGNGSFLIVLSLSVFTAILYFIFEGRMRDIFPLNRSPQILVTIIYFGILFVLVGTLIIIVVALLNIILMKRLSQAFFDLQYDQALSYINTLKPFKSTGLVSEAFWTYEIIVLYTQMRFDEVEQYANTMLSTMKTQQPLLYCHNTAFLGKVAYERGHFQQALEYFRQALDGGESEETILLDIVDIYLKQNKYDEALEAIDKSLEYIQQSKFRGENGIADRELAKSQVLAKLGRIREAEALFGSAVSKLNPTSRLEQVETALAVGRAAKALHKYDIARERFRFVIHTDNNSGICSYHAKMELATLSDE